MNAGALKRKIIRILGDIPTGGGSGGEPIAGGQYDADLLMDSIHAALDAITVRVWKSATDTIDANAEDHDFPDDLIDIEGVFDLGSGVFIPESGMYALGTMNNPEAQNAWVRFPDRVITFSEALGDDGGVLYYSAFWTKPEDDDDTIEAPDIASTALVMYAASYVLMQQASLSANVRQFNTKVDSGAPTDIPAEDMSVFFLKRFEIELGRIPAMRKGTT